MILLDIEMPRMDGFEFTQDDARATPQHAHIPIIMITSRTAEKHRNLATELGVDLYLGKPYQEDDHMAEGIKSLWNRPYFDKGRVGINGTSFGGYTSAMEILRHPEVFAAASASSPVTEWNHYDTIYTERYMWIPQENKEGYDKGSAMTYAKDLKGRCCSTTAPRTTTCIPNNSMQFIRPCSRPARVRSAGRPGRRPLRREPQRMMEFFIENLIQHPERLLAPGGGS